jgi:hypothetical protein
MENERNTMVFHGVDIPHDRVSEFCRRHSICRLTLFGSILRDDFNPESDVDILVEFEPGRAPGLIRLSGMELELSELLGGRKTDMRTLQDLSRYFREKVISESEILYERE